MKYYNYLKEEVIIENDKKFKSLKELSFLDLQKLKRKDMHIILKNERRNISIIEDESLDNDRVIPLFECEDVEKRIKKLRYTLDNTDSEYFDIETLDGLINNCYKLIESCKTHIKLIDLENE